MCFGFSVGVRPLPIFLVGVTISVQRASAHRFQVCAETASRGVRTRRILISTFFNPAVGSVLERKQEMSKWA